MLCFKIYQELITNFFKNSSLLLLNVLRKEITHL